MAGNRAPLKRIGPQLLVSEVACRALGFHFNSVDQLARKASKGAGAKVEAVHQLRVATRRAVAVMDMFSDVCPPKRSAQLRRRLRRIRRLAGPVRDFDVLIERLEREFDTQRDIDGAYLIRRLRKKRSKVYEEFCNELVQIGGKSVRQQSRALIKRIRWKGEGNEPLLVEFATVRLDPMFVEFVVSGDALDDPGRLHAMRVCGKRLRYSFEVLGRAFPKPIRKPLSAALAEIQEQLGIVNDHVTAAAQFENWATRKRGRKHAALFARLLEEERELVRSSSAEFRQWWIQSQRLTLLGRLRAVFEKTVATTQSDRFGKALCDATMAAGDSETAIVGPVETLQECHVQHNAGDR